MHEYWIHSVHYLPDGSAIESVRVHFVQDGVPDRRDLEHPVSQVLSNMGKDVKYYTARRDLLVLRRCALVVPDGEHIKTVANSLPIDNLENLPRF